MLISRIEKAKIEAFSPEIINRAISKCNEGTIFLNQAIEKQSNALLVNSLEAFQDAIRIYSRITEPYLALAYISWKMGKRTEAISFISKALEIDPKNSKAINLFNKINKDTKSEIKNIVTSYTEKKTLEKIKVNESTLNRFNSVLSKKNQNNKTEIKDEKDFFSVASVKFSFPLK